MMRRDRVMRWELSGEVGQSDEEGQSDEVGIEW